MKTPNASAKKTPFTSVHIVPIEFRYKCYQSVPQDHLSQRGAIRVVIAIAVTLDFASERVSWSSELHPKLGLLCFLSTSMVQRPEIRGKATSVSFKSWNQSHPVFLNTNMSGLVLISLAQIGNQEMINPSIWLLTWSMIKVYRCTIKHSLVGDNVSNTCA